VSLFRSQADGSTHFALGVFQAGTDSNDFEAGPGSTIALTGRFTATPILEEDGGCSFTAAMSSAAVSSLVNTVLTKVLPAPSVQCGLSGLCSVANIPPTIARQAGALGNSGLDTQIWILWIRVRRKGWTEN
jgi:hypothetical protein